MGAKVRAVAGRKRMVLQAMAVLEQEQPILVDGVGGHVGPARRLAAGEGDKKRIVEQGEAVHPPAAVRKGEQHAIELAAMERVAGGLAGLLAQEQPELGPLPPEARQQPRQQERRDRRDHAEPQLAGERLAGGADDVGKLLRLAQDPLRLGGDLDAERGEADHPPGALDQGHADLRFELLDPRRQRRLGDEAGVGGAAEMAVILQRHQILELLQGGEMDVHALIARFDQCGRSNELRR